MIPRGGGGGGSAQLFTSSFSFTRDQNEIAREHLMNQGQSPFSSSSSSPSLTFETTPLGKDGKELLNGLDVYRVPCESDGHPLAVYGIQSQQTDEQHRQQENVNRPLILLLHGRTWSSVPVYHLLGGNSNTGHKSLSFMELLYQHGMQPYAMDFRGFGGTHCDQTGYVEPLQCVKDIESVLEWMAKRHNTNTDTITLLGWSQGALIAQLGAQKSNPKFGKLILYGSIYDPLVRYPREPLYKLNNYNKPNMTRLENTYDMALEDFTLDGTIAPEHAQLFAKAALTSDPIKAVWKHVYQFNNCDPARVGLPTLVVAGDQDPYAPLHVQQDLFAHLGRGCDRTWSILSGCDHAVHLLEDGRERLVRLVTSFVGNKNERRT